MHLTAKLVAKDDNAQVDKGRVQRLAQDMFLKTDNGFFVSMENQFMSNPTKENMEVIIKS